MIYKVRIELKGTYDFGDYWEHSVGVVKEVKDERLLHPRCIEGEGACPPEDVGGNKSAIGKS